MAFSVVTTTVQSMSKLAGAAKATAAMDPCDCGGGGQHVVGSCMWAEPHIRASVHQQHRVGRCISRYHGITLPAAPTGDYIQIGEPSEHPLLLNAERIGQVCASHDHFVN